MRPKSGNVREQPPTETGPRWPRRESVRAAGISSLGFTIPLILVALIVAAIAAAVALTRNPCYCVDESKYTFYPAPTYPTYPPASAATRLRDARHLLTGVILPPGSVAVTPPPELRPVPATLEGSAPATDAGGRVWRVPLTTSQARAFFNVHPPRGTRPDASNPAAEGSGATALVGLYYSGGPPPGSGLTSLELVVVLDPVGPATTLVRVDAQADSQAP
jgi:hypothetical protein